MASHLKYCVVVEIRNALVRRGINQSELARRMGVHRALISKILTKRVNLTLDTLEKIGECLEADWQIELR